MFLAQGRKHSPPIVVGTLLVSSLVLRCASKDDSGTRLEQTDAAVTGQGGRSQISPSTGGSRIFVGTGGNDYVPPTDGPIDSGPYYSCQPTSVEKSCPPPDPICEDATTLAFFTAATCVDGSCQWTRQTRACAGSCKDGACDAAGDASDRQRDAGALCGNTIAGDATTTDVGAPRVVACAIPPSLCLGRSQLLYFVNPTCVDGSCRTTAMLRYCGTCANGSCVRNFTL